MLSFRFGAAKALVPAALSLVVAACGSRAEPPPTPEPTQTPAQLIYEAQRLGPGFLDDCPESVGVSRIRLQLDIPGDPLVSALCRVEVVRSTHSSLVTFTVTWNAYPFLHRRGQVTLRYRVSRLGATDLVNQTGSLPP